MPSEPILLITQEDILQAVTRLAAKIRQDYQGRDLLLIGILKGSFIFMADLVRQLELPVEVDFVKLSSYGAGTKTSGRIKMVQGLKSPIKGRHVLVVEDIVDTGLTVSFLLDYLRKKKTGLLEALRPGR